MSLGSRRLWLSEIVDMPRFFVLAKSSEQRSSMAYAEVVSPCYEQEPIRCSACSRPVASLRWRPPFRVWLKNPRRIPDLIHCFGGPELLVSAGLHEAFRHAQLKGIERAYPVEVVHVGTRSSRQRAPSLFGIDLVHSYCRVNFDACDTSWSSPQRAATAGSVGRAAEEGRVASGASSGLP